MNHKFTLFAVCAILCGSLSACADSSDSNHVTTGSTPSSSSTSGQQPSADSAGQSGTKGSLQAAVIPKGGGKIAAEKALYEIYSRTDIGDEEKVAQMMRQIAGINWTTYNRISGHKTLETVEYLYKQLDKIEAGDYPNIVRAGNGTDGASAESYAAILAKLYTREPSKFIEALAGLETPSQIESVVSHLAYGLSDQNTAQVKGKLEQLKQTGDLSVAEQSVADQLLDRLDHPY
ncbi:hypothetical protein [Paenibacillus sp. S28]|uniref:hypothetical protein n=1 Tax=Paenibacillus sp. S28 TaxID=2767463 RepID=UPI00190BE59C|nr:hypothetical protein [Paenibacillus sp. S28]MBJ9987138.1 hypothetical protein [Paenibacillus sp. S28]